MLAHEKIIKMQSKQTKIVGCLPFVTEATKNIKRLLYSCESEQAYLAKQFACLKQSLETFAGYLSHFRFLFSISAIMGHLS